MDKKGLIEAVNNNLLSLDNKCFDILEDLLKYTLEKNQLFNLTAIKEEGSFRELMIYDSLLPLKYFSFTDNDHILDVGTGAGFPGLPLAICSKGKFILLDSTNKKIAHIATFLDKYHLNGEAICDRAEHYAQQHREQYDYVIARAVAPLNILLELCIPLLKVGGKFIAMKGSKGEEEIKESLSALKKLDASVINVYKDELPESGEVRFTIEIIKNKATNKKYPRDYSTIKAKAL